MSLSLVLDIANKGAYGLGDGKVGRATFKSMVYAEYLNSLSLARTEETLSKRSDNILRQLSLRRVKED